MTEKSSPSGKLIVSQDGPVTTITLNRPKVHNALDQEISAELNAAVKDVAVDRDCRVLILRGAGNTFCAGDDIKGFLDFAPDDGPWNIRMYQETVNIIDDLVPVTIAGVDGVCAGGGLELTLVCDFVIAVSKHLVYFLLCRPIRGFPVIASQCVKGDQQLDHRHGSELLAGVVTGEHRAGR